MTTHASMLYCFPSPSALQNKSLEMCSKSDKLTVINADTLKHQLEIKFLLAHVFTCYRSDLTLAEYMGSIGEGCANQSAMPRREYGQNAPRRSVASVRTSPLHL